VASGEPRSRALGDALTASRRSPPPLPIGSGRAEEARRVKDALAQARRELKESRRGRWQVTQPEARARSLTRRRMDAWPGLLRFRSRSRRRRGAQRRRPALASFFRRLRSGARTRCPDRATPRARRLRRAGRISDLLVGLPEHETGVLGSLRPSGGLDENDSSGCTTPWYSRVCMRALPRWNQMMLSPTLGSSST